MSFKLAAIALALAGASLHALGSLGQERELGDPQRLRRAPPSATHATPKFLAIHAQPRLGVQASVRTNSHPLNPDSDISTSTPTGPSPVLPLWSFKINAPRGEIREFGASVGSDPFKNPGTDRIKTFIVPIIVRTHRIATGYDPSTGLLATQPRDVTIDPTLPDQSCMMAPNDVPLTVVRQSPIFTPTRFIFGGVDVGTTQYLDAFQRANYWQVLGNKIDRYHVLLDPIEITQPLVLDVPANEGIAVSDPQLFASALGVSFCAPLQFVDYFWFDSYLRGTLLPALARAGADQTTLPIFVFYDAALSYGVDNVFNCCVISEHEVAGYPVPIRPFIVATFDRSGFFSGPPGGLDVDPLSREVLNWGNDPYFEDEAALYYSPILGACDDALDPGHPTWGTSLPPLTMPNGYQYTLGEGAFFSWFYGGPSFAVNGWYSDGGTFRSDAGPLCH